MTDIPTRDGAGLANWREPPFSRWAFRHLREILPTAPIAGAPDDPLPLPQAPTSLDAFRLPLPGGGEIDLARFLEITASDALVVLLDGQLVHETYAPGMTARTSHLLMSASKTITGLVAGILHHGGALDLDEPISDLIPEIADTAWRGATARHLLDMRAGVALNPADLAAYAAAIGWDPPTAATPTADMRAFFSAMTSPWAPHGGPFAYVSANTDLLAWVLERAGGRPFADLVADLIWRPMGAADEACVTLDGAGLARASGGLCATPHDFARLGQLIVDGGRRGDRQVVPTAWIEDVCRNGDRDAWDKGEFGPGFAPMGMSLSYRGGWYVIEDEPQTLFAMGIHGQNLFVDRANRLVIAKLSTLPVRIDPRALALTHLAVPEIRRCLLDA